jgi:hypothetical protein
MPALAPFIFNLYPSILLQKTDGLLKSGVNLCRPPISRSLIPLRVLGTCAALIFEDCPGASGKLVETLGFVRSVILVLSFSRKLCRDRCVRRGSGQKRGDTPRSNSLVGISLRCVELGALKKLLHVTRQATPLVG